MRLLQQVVASGRPFISGGSRLLQQRRQQAAAAASTIQSCNVESTQQAQPSSWITSDTTSVRRTIVEKLQERQLNSGLDFFKDPDVHSNDLQALWYKEWIFAGHDCELPKAGSYLALQVGAYPIVIVRAKDKTIRAFHNICRHRGFKICDDGNGVVMRRLMCPYHQWTYDLDGKLAFARDFGSKEDGFDKAKFSLLPVALEIADGHIFVCLAETPKQFEPLRDHLESTFLAPFDLKSSKVAYQSRRILQTNWKKVWTTPNDSPPNPGMVAVASDSQYRFVNHTEPGSLSENESVMDHIVWNHYPNIWGTFKSSHAISCRLLPVSATQTELLIKWLVPGDAEEGSDYSLQELTDVQKEEDLQQDAVEHAYPVLHGEDASNQFVDWYSDSMVKTFEGEVSIAA